MPAHRHQVEPVLCCVDYDTPLEVQFARLAEEGVIRIEQESEITSANYPPRRTGIVEMYVAEWHFGDLFATEEDVLAAFRKNVEARFPDRLTDPYAAAAYLRAKPSAAAEWAVVVIGQARDGTEGRRCVYFGPNIPSRVGENEMRRMHPNNSYLTEVPNWPN